MRLRVKRNILLFAVAAIMISSLYALPNQVKADPPPDPPGPTLPLVFCIRMTDITLDQTDPQQDKFTFEFEVLNWSDTNVDGVELVLAKPALGNVHITSAGVDTDGRPLLFVDVDGDGNVTDPPGTEDLEDTNFNGVLDLGEDLNGNERLDNDPIPGNQNTSNDWSAVSTTTKATWSAPSAASAIPFRDLLSATTSIAANQLIPHFPPDTAGPLGVTIIDNNGDVTPKEAIDDGENVLDGFTITLDDFDAGETVTFNWRFTNGGNDIGTPSSGNAYGFGTLSLARVNGGAIPDPIFVPNTGFAQTQTEFYDSVFNVSTGSTSPNLIAQIELPTFEQMLKEVSAQMRAESVKSEDLPTAPTNTLPFIETSENSSIFQGVIEFDLDESIPFHDFPSPGDRLFLDLNPDFNFFEDDTLRLDFNIDGSPSLQDAPATISPSQSFSIIGSGPAQDVFQGPGNLQVTFSLPPVDGTISITYEWNCDNCPDSNGNGIVDPMIVSYLAQVDVKILDLDAAGAGDNNTSLSNGDTITATFNQPTNQADVSTTAAIDSIITFNQNIGLSHSGLWINNGQTLVITVDDATGGNAIIGSLFATLNSGSSLSSANGEASISTSSSPVLRGNFGTVAPQVPPDPPVITNPTDGATITTSTVTLTGTSEANASIEVFDNTVSLGTATADSNGDWIFVATSQADGSHSYTATANDGVTTSAASDAVNVTVDTTGAISCSATLSGSDEVSPVSTSASGTATLQLNAAQTRLTISTSLSGLDLDGLQTTSDSGDDVTGAHIHRGAVGVDGPIIFGMISPSDDLNGDLVIDPVAGTIFSAWDSNEGNVTTLTDELTNLLNDGLYLNIHTTNNSGGEIRGQISCETEPTVPPTAWTQAVLDLRLTKSQAFQDIFPIDTNEEINRLLAWAGNPVAQANNPELQEFGHLYSIMKRWNERTDLQIAFPGADLAADPVNLVIWSGRANVLANAFNSDLVPHEPTYVLLRIFFLERDDLRDNPVFAGALDASDPKRLYCFAANSSDPRLTPHTAFYTANCVL